jgi:hypothetical protein
MSSAPYEDDDLYDPFEAQSGGGGFPVISWKYARIGESFEGVVVPPEPVKAPERGYKMAREYQNGTDLDPNDKGFLVWPPRGNTEGINRPVTEAFYAKTWGQPLNDDKGRPAWRKVSRTNISFVTAYDDGRFISDPASKRMIENEQDPKAEKGRRVILSGKDLNDKVAAALAKVGGKPANGQRWKITLADRVANIKNGQTSIYSVEILPANEASQKVVGDHITQAAAAAREVEAVKDPDDPWATGPSTASASSALPEEPPF